MTQTSEFDPHAVIKWLAKQEQRPLLDSSGTGIWRCPSCRQCSDQPQAIDHTDECQRVPFAALRVECDWPHLWHAEEPQISYEGGSSFQRLCYQCEGRRWVSQPNVKVACWELCKALFLRLVASAKGYMAYYPTGGSVYQKQSDSGWCVSAEEAVLRAAETLVKECPA